MTMHERKHEKCDLLSAANTVQLKTHESFQNYSFDYKFWFVKYASFLSKQKC